MERPSHRDHSFLQESSLNPHAVPVPAALMHTLEAPGDVIFGHQAPLDALLAASTMVSLTPCFYGHKDT